jgi:hypothetical protein
MSSDNHMTDICGLIVKVKNDHPLMFASDIGSDMEAKLWATCFRAANPHMFNDPWDLYRKLPEVIGDFVAMWSDKCVDVKCRDDLVTANPHPEDQFSLIIEGRAKAPELFKDPTTEAMYFAYCLNCTRPHGGHGRLMYQMMPQVLQEFVERWKFVEDIEPQPLPPGLVEWLEPKESING